MTHRVIASIWIRILMLLGLLFHIFFDLITIVWETLLFLVIHVLWLSVDAFCVVA